MKEGVFGEVESPVVFQHDVIHSLAGSEQAFLSFEGHREIHREGISINCMGEKECILAVSFHHHEVRGMSPFLAEADEPFKTSGGGFFGDKALVLDKSPGLIGELPVGNAVKKEVEGHEGLKIGMPVFPLGEPEFRGIDDSHPEVAHEGLHQAMHLGSRQDSTEGIG
jgi:hypothetical protein